VVNASFGDCEFNEHVASCTLDDSPNRLGNNLCRRAEANQRRRAAGASERVYRLRLRTRGLTDVVRDPADADPLVLDGSSAVRSGRARRQLLLQHVRQI
jgi:hypothetical protein